MDVEPRKNRAPIICTKNNNEFYGEPDTPISEDTQEEFVPMRDV